MARTAAAAAAQAIRRDAFIDVAQQLIQSKSYQQMTVQDVLDELDASRGAFYHYFDSKAELLDAVVERMVDAAIADVQPAVDAPRLDAPARLAALFEGIGRWKGERTGLLLTLMETWMDDDNALTRDKFRRSLVPRMAPLLARIVEQGNAEGTLHAFDPEPTARVLVSLIQGLNETAVELFFGRQADRVTLGEVERMVAAYAVAFERVLGIPPGSVRIVDPEALHYWFESPIAERKAS